MNKSEISKLANKLFPLEYGHIEAVQEAMTFRWRDLFKLSFWRK